MEEVISREEQSISVENPELVQKAMIVLGLGLIFLDQFDEFLPEAGVVFESGSKQVDQIQEIGVQVEGVGVLLELGVFEVHRASFEASDEVDHHVGHGLAVVDVTDVLDFFQNVFQVFSEDLLSGHLEVFLTQELLDVTQVFLFAFV